MRHNPFQQTTTAELISRLKTKITRVFLKWIASKVFKKLSLCKSQVDLATRGKMTWYMSKIFGRRHCYINLNESPLNYTKLIKLKASLVRVRRELSWKVNLTTYLACAMVQGFPFTIVQNLKDHLSDTFTKIENLAHSVPSRTFVWKSLLQSHNH